MDARKGCAGGCGGGLSIRQAWNSSERGSLELEGSVLGSGKMPEHTSARASHSSSSTSSPQSISVEKSFRVKIGLYFSFQVFLCPPGGTSHISVPIGLILLIAFLEADGQSHMLSGCLATIFAMDQLLYKTGIPG